MIPTIHQSGTIKALRLTYVAAFFYFYLFLSLLLSLLRLTMPLTLCTVAWFYTRLVFSRWQ